MKTKKKKYSPFLKSVEKFSRNKMAVIGLIIVILMILTSVFAPILTPYQPDGISPKEKLLTPCLQHLFGTDKLGRDVLCRLMYGGRVSISIGMLSAIAAVAVGVILGALCGYFGGIGDKILVRISEVFMAFPSTILILIMVAFIGQGTANLFIVFIATGWTSCFRMVRGKFMSMREDGYVITSKAFGIKDFSIMFKHILPNTLGPIIVQMTALMAMFILQESALSFLGLGVPSSTVTWGNIINAAKDVTVIKKYPWLWIPPGLAISLLVLGTNFVGDGLRDIFDAAR